MKKTATMSELIKKSFEPTIKSVIDSKKNSNVIKNCYIRILILKLAHFISGILLSRGSIFGYYYPFGLSFLAAVPEKMFISTAMGAALGYMLPLRLAFGMRYICALLAISAIKWTLSDFKKITGKSFYAPMVVFLPSIVTGLALNCVDGMYGKAFFVSFTESIIAAAAGYFFAQSYKILLSENNSEFSVGNLVCVAISWSLILLSANSVCIGCMSIGRVAAIVTIITAAYITGTVGGTIFGTSLGAIFSVPSFGFTYVSGVYAFGGMICGLFSKFGKIGTCASFLISGLIISLQAGDTTKVIIGVYESLFAITIFLILPKSFLKKINLWIISDHFEMPKSAYSNESGLKNIAAQKLISASKLLAYIPKIIDKISKNFQNVPYNSVAADCEKSLKDNCGSCNKREYCYTCYKDETAKNFNFAITQTANGCPLDETIFSKDFRTRCNKLKKILNDFENTKKKYIAKKSEFVKMQDMRKAAGDQLFGISHFIGDISSEICRYESFDESTYSKIENELQKRGIEAISINCRKSKNIFGNIFIEIEIPRNAQNMLTDDLRKALGNICGKTLEMPIFTGLGESVRVQICEKTKYKIEIGVAQHNCNNASTCGDSYKFFEDGIGNFHIILSDGMGTGKKASQEGDATSELMKSFIKAGMGLNCALKLVNSSILFKSSDEFISTLDVASVNLFSGNAKFMKAGAPATFVLSGNEISKIEFSAPPIGIFSNISATIKEHKLHKNDKIVMLSDGATDIGDSWLLELLETFRNLSPKNLSNKIIETATKLRKNSYDDDITAVVMHMIRR